jgi:hypothetical protein
MSVSVKETHGIRIFHGAEEQSQTPQTMSLTRTQGACITLQVIGCELLNFFFNKTPFILKNTMVR